MKLAYYRNHPYRGMIETELRNLDLNVCQKYYDMRNVIIINLASSLIFLIIIYALANFSFYIRVFV
jgi:hypothetical protein